MYALIHDFDLADAFPIIQKMDCTRFHHSRQSVANMCYMDYRDTKRIFVSRKKKKIHETTILSVYPF